MAIRRLEDRPDFETIHVDEQITRLESAMETFADVWLMFERRGRVGSNDITGFMATEYMGEELVRCEQAQTAIAGAEAGVAARGDSSGG